MIVQHVLVTLDSNCEHVNIYTSLDLQFLINVNYYSVFPSQTTIVFTSIIDTIKYGQVI
jgi:hypothetical protein